jgi:hypothetical protein
MQPGAAGVSETYLMSAPAPRRALCAEARSTARPGSSYNGDVARGWESKSVEAQIESARAREGHLRQRLTVEQAAAEKKRDSLLLQRTRMLRQIESCTGGRYRKTLTDGLAYLEAQLTELGWQRE